MWWFWLVFWPVFWHLRSFRDVVWSLLRQFDIWTDTCTNVRSDIYVGIKILTLVELRSEITSDTLFGLMTFGPPLRHEFWHQSIRSDTFCGIYSDTSPGKWHWSEISINIWYSFRVLLLILSLRGSDIFSQGMTLPRSAVQRLGKSESRQVDDGRGTQEVRDHKMQRRSGIHPETLSGEKLQEAKHKERS